MRGFCDTRPGSIEAPRYLQRCSEAVQHGAPLGRGPLGLRLGLCALPWRVAAHFAAQAMRHKAFDVQVFPAMARPGPEPGTPRFSAVVSSRRPGRAASQRPLPFARRSTLPTPRSPSPSPRRARPARPRGRRRRGSRRATPPSEYRAAWQIRRWGAARYVVLQMFAARRRPTVDASVSSSSKRGLSEVLHLAARRSRAGLRRRRPGFGPARGQRPAPGRAGRACHAGSARRRRRHARLRLCAHGLRRRAGPRGRRLHGRAFGHAPPEPARELTSAGLRAVDGGWCCKRRIAARSRTRAGPARVGGGLW